MANKIGMRSKVVLDPNGKKCSACHRKLSADKRSFDSHPDTRDKLKARCKECIYKRNRTRGYSGVPVTITRAVYVPTVVNGRTINKYTKVQSAW